MTIDVFPNIGKKYFRKFLAQGMKRRKTKELTIL